MINLQEALAQTEALLRAGRSAEAKALCDHLLPLLPRHAQDAYWRGMRMQLETREQEKSVPLLQWADQAMVVAQRLAPIKLELEMERYRQIIPRPTTGKNVILCMAGGYSIEQLAPFVISLRASGYTGDTVMFVAELSAEALRFLRDHGIILRSFEGQNYFNMPVNQSRYIKYYEFLREQELLLDGVSPYEYILMTDMSDVIFQRDPFAFPQRDTLLYFLEDPSKRLGNCAWNKIWLASAFGMELAELWKNHKISCSGTTFGTFEGIMHYLLLMQALFLRTPNEMSRRLMILDQAIHNYIFYRDLIPGARVLENGGIVQTMCYVPRNRFTLRTDGIIVNQDGTISPILHQYNRHDDITRAIQAKYRAP